MEEEVGEVVVVGTTIVGEEEEMVEGDVEVVEMAMVVNLVVSLLPRAVRKYTLVHNWTKIYLRTSGILESTFPSTRTSQ